MFVLNYNRLDADRYSKVDYRKFYVKMAKIQDHPIGEIFEYKGSRYKTLPSSFCCDGCCFATTDTCECSNLPCYPQERDDSEDVIFRKVHGYE